MAAFDWADVNITVPRTPHRLPGIRMAGFSHRAARPIDLAMIAHPAVTLLFNLGPGEFTVHLAPNDPATTRTPARPEHAGDRAAAEQAVAAAPAGLAVDRAGQAMGLAPADQAVNPVPAAQAMDPVPATLAIDPVPARLAASPVPAGRTVGPAPAPAGKIVGSAVIGLLPGAVRTAGTNGDLLQIRLEPTVAAVLLGPCTELTGMVAALHDVWGHDAEARLRAVTSWEDRFATAADILGRRLHSGRTVDREVTHAWRRIRTSHGRIRVDDLAGEVGWSRQRLWSRFRSQLGVVPKRAARLARFDLAAHLLAAGHPIADVAARAGYADQSHLHRDAGEFTGLTPAAVAAAPWLAIDDVTWPAPG